MSMSRRAWATDAARRRLAGRRGMEAQLRERFAAQNGRALPPEPDGLTALLFHRMIRASRSKDVSLAPYVDKLLVRDYVAARVGADHLVPLVWSGRNPWDVPLDAARLPAVLKPNHMSQAVLIVDRTTPRRLVVRKGLRWLAENYYWTGGEYQYSGIRRQLLLEEFLDDGTPYGPRNYSYWCVHGEPLFIQARDSTLDMRESYDLDWRPLPVLTAGPRRVDAQRPAALGELNRVARALAAAFSFVRVDLYEVRGRVLFGELTFTPVSGRLPLRTPEIDRYLGGLVLGGADALDGAHERLAELAHG